MIVLLSCLAYGIPFGGEHGAFYRSMGIITAGAPCGLMLAPLAYVCALANASRRYASTLLVKRLQGSPDPLV